MPDNAIQAGERLVDMRMDEAIRLLCAPIGLRGARRMIREGGALLNGQVASASKRLRRGDIVRILPRREHSGKNAALIATLNGYHFFYKPAGMHTQSLAGGGNASLEGLIDDLPGGAGRPILLQRLDYGSSGIVCAAGSQELARKFREAERADKCLKLYYAILSGVFEEARWARNAIDANGRRAARISNREAPRRLWTRFEPLWTGFLEDFSSQATLVRCALRAGQRHQIRAHAKALGHPLLGDSLYGKTAARGFFLEHFYLEFPGAALAHVSDDSLARRILGAAAGHVGAGGKELCML